jgi:hypothetical protein
MNSPHKDEASALEEACGLTTNVSRRIEGPNGEVYDEMEF